MVAGGRELIDTLWNVNMSKFRKVSCTEYELIDTLWNVNFPQYRTGLFRRKHELIDTLWNVNER